MFRARTAVDEVEDPLVEFTLDEARALKADAQPGELVETEELHDDVFGRIGAQTAKQIVLQRIREVERDQVFDQFANREGEMITGAVNRVEPRAIILDVGNNVEAILATSEQSPVEHYRIGQNVKAYVLEVRRSSRGPQILVSRTHKGFLKRLFELEVPEIHSGTVEIKAIAREAGSRSKVAVSSRQEGLDPVGATVGQRGARVQAVVAELGGEKIDVIPWNDDASVFVANALSPAQVHQRRHRRGAPDRERHRSRADALAGDRPRGPERPARRAPDGLADRHPQRRLGRRGEGRRRTRRRRPAPRPPDAEAAADEPRRRPRPPSGARGRWPRPPSRRPAPKAGRAGDEAARDEGGRRRTKARMPRPTASRAGEAAREEGRWPTPPNGDGSRGRRPRRNGSRRPADGRRSRGDGARRRRRRPKTAAEEVAS